MVFGFQTCSKQSSIYDVCERLESSSQEEVLYSGDPVKQQTNRIGRGARCSKRLPNAMEVRWWSTQDNVRQIMSLMESRQI